MNYISYFSNSSELAGRIKMSGPTEEPLQENPASLLSKLPDDLLDLVVKFLEDNSLKTLSRCSKEYKGFFQRLRVDRCTTVIFKHFKPSIFRADHDTSSTYHDSIPNNEWERRLLQIRVDSCATVIFKHFKPSIFRADHDTSSSTYYDSIPNSEWERRLLQTNPPTRREDE